MTSGADRARDEAERFAKEHLVGAFAERERTGTFFREGWEACTRTRLFERLLDADPATLFRTLQGLGRGTPDLGFLLSLSAHLWGSLIPLSRHGGRRWVTGLASGKTIGTHAITEPDAGSDLAGMCCVAVKEGDAYRLRGTKTYITNAPIADLFLVYAKQGSSDRSAPFSVFAVEKSDRGVTLTRTFSKMGLRTAPMGELSFDVRIPTDRLLGEEGSGLAQFHAALEQERAGIFACVLGVMETQLERAIRRARERTSFEKPIGAHQSVTNRIVDMKMRVDIGQLLLDRYIALKVQDRRAPLESAMAKLFLSEAFVASSIAAVEIHGALGYVEEGGIEHHVRDAIGGLLLSGTSDMQRLTIARMIGLESQPREA